MLFRSFISPVLIVALFAPVFPVHAATTNLPRYSSVTDATSAAFTTSYRNLSETEYVTCSLPAPVTCKKGAGSADDLSNGLGGYRNEAGTLLIAATPDGTGSVSLVAYTMQKGSWKEKDRWSLVGGVSKVHVGNDGLHFGVQAVDGSFISYALDTKKPLASARLTPSGSAVTYSSTGKYLAWYKPASLTSGNGQRCYVLADTRTGKTVESCDAVEYWDLVSEDNRVFTFSPTDSVLIFRSDRDGWQKPYKVDLSKGFPKSLVGESLIGKPYQIADMVFVDGDRLALVANRTSPTSWGLWNFSLRANTITQIADSVSYGVSLKRFGSYVSFARTTNTGASATLWNVTSGSVTPIESLAKVTVPSGALLPKPTSVVSVSGGGGYGLWEPARITPTTPVVIYLHGGPYRQIATNGYHSFSSYGTFDWMLEQVRQSGAVVAKLDYPGSYGYGRAYAESLTGNVGKKDVASVAAMIATLKKKYGAGTPVYLIGNSYGGYLADKVLVEYPKSVAGIYSISGVSGWEELIASNPETIFNAPFKNAPFGQGHQLFAQAEVLLKVGNIGSQKIFLAHGASDNSVSVSQTKTFDQVLQLPKKNVSTTIYPGEDHVFTQKSTLSDVCKKMIELIGGSASGKCQL